MNAICANFSAIITDKTKEMSMVAIQGPRSEAVIKEVLSLDLSKLRYYRFINVKIMDESAMVSRTGYTGEDGFEIMAQNKLIQSVWGKLLASKSVTPSGLGARDTLRTEAGMPLYGNDIDDSTNPVEAGLRFTISFDKPDFIGRSSIQNAQPTRKLIGFTMLSKRVARQGHEIYKDNNKVGVVTSGTFSPTFQKSIGMCYFHSSHARPDENLSVDIRGKKEEIRIQELPFYRRQK
jgi:aminomethyltransferase